MTPVLAEAGGEGQAAALLFWTSLAPAGGMLAALPLALLAAARLPRAAARALDAGRRFPVRSILVGVLAALATLLLLGASKASPLFGLAGLLSLAAFGVLALLGLAAEARRLGCELRDADPAAPGTAGGATAVGWLLLAGMPLVLVAGPLVFLYLALRAAGASVMALAAGGDVPK